MYFTLRQPHALHLVAATSEPYVHHQLPHILMHLVVAKSINSCYLACIVHDFLSCSINACKPSVVHACFPAGVDCLDVHAGCSHVTIVLDTQREHMSYKTLIIQVAGFPIQHFNSQGHKLI